MKPLVLIVGPTAVGKSDFALQAAERYQGAIVNCDSLQVYQGLNVGTAKPTPETMKRVPHFLFDKVAVGQRYTAGEFRRDALEVIERELPKQPLFLCGGSGFYIQALEKGMFEVDPVSDEIMDRVKTWMEEKGLAAAYQRIEEKDPEYAAKIAPTDQYRIFRALTLMESEGQTMTTIQQRFKEQSKKEGLRHPLLKIGFQIERSELRQRVRTRAEQMWQRGLVDEVRDLLKQVPREWPPLQSVGYKETIQYLEGAIDTDQWLEEMVNSTMKLAKRQMTWFRRDPEIQWFNGESEQKAALSFLDSHFDRRP